MESSLVDNLKLYAHRRVIGFSRQEGQELFVGTISAAALSWVSMNHAVGYQGFGRSNNRAVINDTAFQLDAIRVQLHNGFRLICEAQPNG